MRTLSWSLHQGMLYAPLHPSSQRPIFLDRPLPLPIEPALSQRPFVPPNQPPPNIPGVRYEDYYSSPQASHSSLTLPSNDSSASSHMSPPPSSVFLSRISTPTGMPPEPRQDQSATVASPVAEQPEAPHGRDESEDSFTSDSDSIAELKRRQREVVNAYEQGLSRGTPANVHPSDEASSSHRPMSPPPEYEPVARPMPFRNDSAPELRHVDPPGLPHRSATAPIPAAPSQTVSRRPTDRRAQAYDLDRIDELDESNPLGVALHHEGPFQAIASMLKSNSPHENQSVPHMRPLKAPKPGYNGGSLGISPGQILPRNFPYYQAPVQPALKQDYPTPQASTSYLAPQPQFDQSPYTQSHMRAPPIAREPVNQDPRWSQPPVQTSYDARASYMSQTQYDPVDQPSLLQRPAHTGNSMYSPPPSADRRPPPQNPTHTGNSYHSQSNSSHSSVAFSSEDAYGGIEEDVAPRRDRYSAPPVPTTSQELHYGQNGSDPRRHTAQPGFNPADPRLFQDPARGNVGSNARHSSGQPVAGFLDPRIFQQRDQLNAGQNSSAMRHSPNGPPNPPTQAYPAPQFAGYNQPQAAQTPPNEHDRRRPASYQPQPAPYVNRAPMQHPPMGEHDPRRRASYQPVQGPPPGAAPADPGRHQFERSQEIAALAQDREQSVTVAPSIAPTNASSTMPRWLPQHTPKNLVMPTPLQQSSPLPGHSGPRSHQARPSPNSSQVRLPLQQSQPTRAQTIQMVQDKDGGRHFLRKRASVVAPPSAPSRPVPPKPPVPRQRSYMEPPPTVPEPPVSRRPVQQEKKRPKRLLSKRRSDL
ncbi:hypothetical protein DFH06DRAFT_487768 [Mycena polygramma]|nr:hypothetical protein DFH06DRAFT_487768 [Mycena polygramma]